MSYEWVMVPREPVDAQLTSMALTYDHGYGLRNAFERENIRLHMAQLHRAMLNAAPAAPQQAEPVAKYHPDASHISPDYRDGWNAALDAVRLHPPADEVQRLRAEVEALKSWQCTCLARPHSERIAALTAEVNALKAAASQAERT